MTNFFICHLTFLLHFGAHLDILLSARPAHLRLRLRSPATSTWWRWWVVSTGRTWHSWHDACGAHILGLNSVAAGYLLAHRLGDIVALLLVLSPVVSVGNLLKKMKTVICRSWRWWKNLQLEAGELELFDNFFCYWELVHIFSLELSWSFEWSYFAHCTVSPSCKVACSPLLGWGLHHSIFK